MTIAIIAAVDQEGGIGKNGCIPWHIPADLKRFKELTKDSICIMGYNTFKEIADKFDYENTDNFLKNRLSYVLTSKNIKQVSSVVESFSNLDAAFESAKKQNKNVFFIGGNSIFEYGLEHCDKLFFTYVKGNYDCNVFFPFRKYLEIRNYKNVRLLAIDYQEDHTFATYGVEE